MLNSLILFFNLFLLDKLVKEIRNKDNIPKIEAKEKKPYEAVIIATCIISQ